MERKLSTIFASDVVGYSKMMGNNEEKTLETLSERREVSTVQLPSIMVPFSAVRVIV